MTPDQFGPYEVYERLGIGGMAQVHRAKKRGPAGFERSVALKRMLVHLAEDATFVESFIREAKVASILAHPNIAQTYDFGRIGGVYYIAMELVPGFDVRKLLRFANRANEPIPLPVVLTILGELADALEYAHTFVDETGTPVKIVHRDISPSNMIVAHTGHLKVIDFGIAKASSRQLHTESGQVKGKLGYMSPEVALGMQVEPVSDVFSMGVVAWELVTASPLFSSRTDMETMRRIREGEITAPSLRNPTIPPELDRLILQSLEREPENRLASAGAFRRALDAITAKLGLVVGPRVVAEWTRQFVQPEDFMRFSGGQLPQDAPTSVQRAQARTPLQRSQDEIALATEVWGEDQAPTAAGGPDFSIAVNEPPPSASLSMPLVPARPTTPMRTQQPPQLPPPVAPHARTNRRGLFLLAGLAAIAAALGVILAVKTSSSSNTTGDRFFASDAATVASAGSAATAPPEPAPEPTPAVTSTEPCDPFKSNHGCGGNPHAPMATATPRVPEPQHEPDTVTAEPQMGECDPFHSNHGCSASKSPTTAPTRPTTKKPTKPRVAAATPHHEEHVEPAPEPAPAPVVETPPAPPTPVPAPPKPEPKPTRTPVVSPAAVTKLSGELPTIKGETNGDVLVKMCIDETGKVTSVKVVKATTDMPPDLAHALEGWRYKPYLNKDQKPTAVCFALSLRVVVKRAD